MSEGNLLLNIRFHCFVRNQTVMNKKGLMVFAVIYLVDFFYPFYNHRRRIKTEEKAKVVAAVWGTESIYFFASQAIMHQDDLKNRINSTWTI